MNALVVYYSKFGNTRSIAEVIGETLEMGGNVQVISIQDVETSKLNGVDLIVMGSPTHNMNLPKSVRPIFEKLPQKILKGKFIAAFDTSYKMSPWLYHFTAGKRLAKKLRKLGGKRIVPPEIFYVTEREGPLYEGEIERSKAWAKRILNQY